jgi:hypothetical protein
LAGIRPKANAWKATALRLIWRLTSTHPRCMRGWTNKRAARSNFLTLRDEPAADQNERHGFSTQSVHIRSPALPSDRLRTCQSRLTTSQGTFLPSPVYVSQSKRLSALDRLSGTPLRRGASVRRDWDPEYWRQRRERNPAIAAATRQPRAAAAGTTDR